MNEMNKIAIATYSRSAFTFVKLANKKLCRLKYSTGSINTCKNVTKLPKSVPKIMPIKRRKNNGYLSARNRKRYKKRANNTMAASAAPKFKNSFSTQTDMDP